MHLIYWKSEMSCLKHWEVLCTWSRVFMEEQQNQRWSLDLSLIFCFCSLKLGFMNVIKNGKFLYTLKNTLIYCNIFLQDEKGTPNSSCITECLIRQRPFRYLHKCCSWLKFWWSPARKTPSHKNGSADFVGQNVTVFSVERKLVNQCVNLVKEIFSNWPKWLRDLSSPFWNSFGIPVPRVHMFEDIEGPFHFQNEKAKSMALEE